MFVVICVFFGLLILYQVVIGIWNLYLWHILSDRAFLSDSEITNSLFFKLCLTLYRVLAVFYEYDIEFSNPSHVSPPNGVLFVGRHSTHNIDIYLGVFRYYLITGKPLRVLLHRSLCYNWPFSQHAGCVPGNRETAVPLLKSGHAAAVAPGGGEEALAGHESARELRWRTFRGTPRRGFAEVARLSKCVICPVYTRNLEEMRWNPLFEVWNACRLGKAFDWFIGKVTRLRPRFIGWLFFGTGLTCWLFASFFCGLCVPVRARLVVGEPVVYDPERDSAETVAAKTREALERLIAKHNPNGRNYMAALRERWAGGAGLKST